MNRIERRFKTITENVKSWCIYRWCMLSIIDLVMICCHVSCVSKWSPRYLTCLLCVMCVPFNWTFGGFRFLNVNVICLHLLGFAFICLSRSHFSIFVMCSCSYVAVVSGSVCMTVQKCAGPGSAVRNVLRMLEESVWRADFGRVYIPWVWLLWRGCRRRCHRAQVRGGHAITVFWHCNTLYVVVSMACGMFVRPRWFFYC